METSTTQQNPKPSIVTTEPSTSVQSIVAKHKSLPAFIMAALERVPDREILHYFHNDTHTSFTATEARNIIRQGALALKELGMVRGQHIGIMMKSSPQWLFSEQMIHSIGAVSVGIYDNITFKSLEHYIKETELDTVFIDQKNCYEILKSFQTKLKRIIIKDELFKEIETHQSLENVEHLSWSQFLSLGKDRDEKNPEEFQAELAKLVPTDTSALIYTSGSSGIPKGVILTHKDFIYQAAAVAERYPFPKKENNSISILPIAHIFERTVIYFYLSKGIKIHFLSDPTKLIHTISVVRPNVITAVPRLLERVHEGMTEKAKLKPFPLRNLALAAIRRASERTPLSKKQLKDALFERLVYKKLRMALGGRLDFIISGGAALDSLTLRFFFSIGVPVYEGYGLTETAPVISCNNETNFKSDSVGKMLAGIQAKILDTGELIVQTPSLMKGYFKNPEQTKEVLKPASDGTLWFHTGDKARIEDGYIFIEGRIKEFFKTSTAKYVNPVFIEKLITNHPLINGGLVIGESRKFVSALIFIDPLEVEASKTTKTQLEASVQTWVETLNATLEDWERIKKFEIIWKLLTIKENELTPKMNIKRKELKEKFAETINALYN